MAQGRHRALIVGEKSAHQQAAIAALTQQGFDCDCAAIGTQAAQMARLSRYDVAIVNLRIPNERGQALSFELLEAGRSRPLIVVYANVMDPDLAQDFLARGADDIFFKPVDYGSLVAKAITMLDRHPERSHEDLDDGPIGQAHPTQAVPVPIRSPVPVALTAPVSSSVQKPSLAQDSTLEQITFQRLNARLADVSRLMPISAAAIDVYEMTKSCDWSLSQIAAAIQRDASLATEVLRLANSPLFNPAGRPIAGLDKAVMQIGQKRVGELALTTSALSSLTPAMVPWMDLQLVWRRSMAAGIVLEALVERGGHEAIEEGLLLSAIVHPLGRIVLGMMFPKHYEQMVAKCRETGDALQEQERQTLPISHTEVMAHLLASWRVPQDVFLPLKFASDDFSALAHLSKSTRSKTELVKVAILLGRLAVGRWEHWDLLRFPAASVMSRIGIRNVAQIIRQAKADVGKLAEFHPGGKSKPSAADPPIQRRAVAYCNFSGNREDLLAELLLSLGYQPKECSVANLRQLRERPIVNCLGAAPAQFAALRTRNNAIVIADDDKCDQFRRLALTVGLPNSYGRLRDALQRELAEPALEPAVSAS